MQRDGKRWEKERIKMRRKRGTSILALCLIVSFCMPYASALAQEGNEAAKDEEGVNQTLLQQLPLDVQGQEIKEIEVTEDAVTIYYQTQDADEVPTLIIPPELESEYNTEEQIVSITYPLKNGISPMAVGDYRLTQSNSKSTALVRRDEKSASSFTAAANISLVFLGISYPLTSAVLSVASMLGTAILQSMPVRSIIYTSHETDTKHGQVQYIDGMWSPYVAIAQRKYYRHTWGTYTDPGGYPQQGTKDETPTNGYGPIKVVTKDHYNDNAWIKNKALECYRTGTNYYDITF